MKPLRRSHRAVLEALVECAEGAATFAWLTKYTGLAHRTVDNGVHELARRNYAHWVGIVRARGSGGRPSNVYAATPRGRALVSLDTWLADELASGCTEERAA